MEEVLLTFPSTKNAIAAEKALLRAGLSAKVMPMPEALSHQCGICLRLGPEELETGKKTLAEAGIPIQAVYLKQGESLTLHP